MNPELKQWSYSKATKCVMDEPCPGCETHSEYHIANFTDKLASNQVESDPEFNKVVDDNFWDLLEPLEEK